jgi:ectoine hydroxylase-related dioxygenase (phytanoyl-CoA dioxygenase family)
MAITHPDLDTPYHLGPATIQSFGEHGFVRLKNVLSSATIEAYEPEITAKVIELNTQRLPLAERDTYGKAFLQVTNLWQHSDQARQFTYSRRLARIAAELLGVDGVRLYHDQALYKEAGGGFTPWHVDQHYWPLSTDRTVTAWVPLQDTPAELGPLTFSVGSHRSGFGRTLAISDESEVAIDAFVAERGYRIDDAPFALGDVSFHAGWTIHRAPGNTSQLPRRVMTVIYLDADIRITEPANGYQHNDRQNWLSGRPAGGVPDGPLNPILWNTP